MRRRCLILAVLLVLLAPSSALAQGHVSLPQIERQVMCVTCKIPLNVAESPQADDERAFIQRLIDDGHSEAQIKQLLVDQYGEAVLALPRAHGFDLAAYLVPVVALAVFAGLLAWALAGWRRRTHERQDTEPGARELSTSERERLERDMARYEL